MRGRGGTLAVIAIVLAGAIAVSGLSAAADGAKRAKRRNPCLGGALEFFANRTPVPVSGAFDPTVTGMFAVLRRPGGPDDQLPPINPLGEDLTYQLRSYFPEEIRQIATDPDGERYFVIPGYMRVFPIPAARCLPKRLRHLRAELVAKQRLQEMEPTYCIEDIGPHRPRYREATCLGFSTVQTGEAITASAASRSDVIELVPDGIATVRLSYRSGDVINAPVSSNAFSFTPPQGPIKAALKALRPLEFRANRLHEPQLEVRLRRLIKRLEVLFARLIPLKVEWLDAAGHAQRSFSPPSHGEAESGGAFALLNSEAGGSAESGFVGISTG